MLDIILTIFGICIYIPFLVQLFHTHWEKDKLLHQLTVALVSLELTALFHVPSVMYIATVLLITVFAVYAIVKRPTFRWTPILIISILYGLWFAISLFWSAIPLRGARFLLDYSLPLIAFAFLSSIWSISKEDIQQCFRTFGYAGLVFIGLSLLSWGCTCAELNILPWEWKIFGKSYINGENAYRWIFRFNGGIWGYTHPSYNLLPLFAATCGVMKLCKKHVIQPYISWLLWGGATMLTLLSQSRMGIVYAAIILMAGIVYWLPSKRLQLSAACVFLLIGVALLWGTWDKWPQYDMDHNRQKLYDVTWRYIQNKPLQGAGAGALNPIEICHTTGELYWPHVGYIDPQREVTDWQWKVHMLPHNQFMADAAHAGIIAAILSLLMYACVAVRCVRIHSYWGGVMMLIFTLFSFLEPPLYIGKGLYLFCCMICLLYTEKTIS